MKKILDYLTQRRDALLLTAALVLLLAAVAGPSIPLRHNIYSYLVVVDISQSMNTRDMKMGGREVARIEYTRQMLRDLITAMPCGTRVAIAPFVGVSVAPLYTQIEVCANYSDILDTIDHLEWRMGWSGNSRIRESLFSIDRALRALPEPAQVVFFTDGEETPRLHAFNTKDLTGFQSGNGWLLVGIGSDKGSPIPKLDDKNQLIGYWGNDSFAMQPGIAQISEQNIGNRDDKVAAAESDRFLSKLDEPYLKDIAKQIGADYVRGDSLQNVTAAMRTQKPAKRDLAPFGIHWILASMAGLLLLWAHLPKHPLLMLRRRLSGIRVKRR